MSLTEAKNVIAKPGEGLTILLVQNKTISFKDLVDKYPALLKGQ